MCIKVILLLLCALFSGSSALAQSKPMASAQRLTVMIDSDCDSKMENASILEPAKIRGKEELKGNWAVESTRYKIEVVPSSAAFFTERYLEKFFPERANKIWHLTAKHFSAQAAAQVRNVQNSNDLWCFDADLSKLSSWRIESEQRRLWMGIDGRSYFDGLYTVEIHNKENNCIAKIHYVLKAKRVAA